MHRDLFDAALEGGDGGGKVAHVRIVSPLAGRRQQDCPTVIITIIHDHVRGDHGPLQRHVRFTSYLAKRRHPRFVRGLPFVFAALSSGRLTEASRAASARNACTSSPKRTG